MLKPVVAAATAALLVWAAPIWADPAGAPTAAPPPAPGLQAQSPQAQSPQAQSAQAQTPDVATLLFSDPQWRAVPSGSELTYAFSRKITNPALGTSLDDKIVVKVTPGNNPQSRTAEVTAFTQHDPQPAGPFTSDEQNPVLLVFLENNIQELSRLFKANPLYFKSAIRKAWRTDAKVEHATIDVNGKPTPGTRITVQPFLGKPEASRMMGLDGLTYTVDIADDVPGNIADVNIYAPASGTAAFSETLRYEAIKKP